MNTTVIRQIILDIETTGMNQNGIYYEGHNIIEIGAIEIINRRLTNNNFHTYLKPNRLIDPKAFSIHGITNEFLINKPVFSDIADKFINYIYNTELIIHNASFDIGFIDYELSKIDNNFPKISTFCRVIDSLAIARQMFPGKRNNLDALCLRYAIDNSKRKLHSALLDAQILANVYLAMTSGQILIDFQSNSNNQQYQQNNIDSSCSIHPKLKVISANTEELIAHESLLDLIQNNNGVCIWRF